MSARVIRVSSDTRPVMAHGHVDPAKEGEDGGKEIKDRMGCRQLVVMPYGSEIYIEHTRPRPER